MISTGISGLVGLVMIALWVVSFGLCIFALIDAFRQSPAAFSGAGKQTKQRWLVFLGVGTALSFVSVPVVGLGPLNFFNLIAVVAAAVYLVDVRPAVRPYRGGGSSGPYGPW